MRCLMWMGIALSASVLNADDRANELRSRFENDLAGATARYKQQEAEIALEHQRRRATAKAEYNATVKASIVAYANALKSLQKTETEAQRIERATSLYRIRKGPPDVDIQRLWVESFVAEERYDYATAIASVKAAIAASKLPPNYYASMRLAWLSYASQNYDAAEAAYLTACEKAPQAVSPLTGLLYSYAARNKSDKAVETAKRILGLDPMNRVAIRTLADTAYRRGDYTLAASYYERVRQASPEDLDNASYLGWCWLKAGELAKAHALFEFILTVSPGHAYANLGLSSAAAAIEEQNAPADEAASPELDSPQPTDEQRADQNRPGQAN